MRQTWVCPVTLLSPSQPKLNHVIVTGWFSFPDLESCYWFSFKEVARRKAQVEDCFREVNGVSQVFLAENSQCTHSLWAGVWTWIENHSYVLWNKDWNKMLHSLNTWILAWKWTITVNIFQQEWKTSSSF